MIGTNFIYLNETTVARIIQDHLNATLLKDPITVIGATKEYDGTHKNFWRVVVEPLPPPVADNPA